MAMKEDHEFLGRRGPEPDQRKRDEGNRGRVTHEVDRWLEGGFEHLVRPHEEAHRYSDGRANDETRARSAARSPRCLAKNARVRLSYSRLPDLARGGEEEVLDCARVAERGPEAEHQAQREHRQAPSKCAFVPARRGRADVVAGVAALGALAVTVSAPGCLSRSHSGLRALAGREESGQSCFRA